MEKEMNKPGFLTSMLSGIRGYAKGFFAGGAIGAITGAVIGGVVALFSPDAGLAIGKAVFDLGTTSGLLAGAAGGAAIIGTGLASIGSLAGMATEVVRSREAGQPTAQDVVNVAKISFAQGVGVGHQVSQAEQQAAQQETGTAWRDKIEKARAAQQPQQQLH